MEFSPASPPRIFWNSRKRSAAGRSLDNAMKGGSLDNAVKEGSLNDVAKEGSLDNTMKEESLKVPSNDTTMKDAEGDETKEDPKSGISERRKALFEPLEPIKIGSLRTPAEILLPPPDFDPTSYPKGWLLGKRRKLVNVDVVESMRRIAVQEMNRKDREINGLNEQLEEDAKCLEHLQVQLLRERSKRAEVERENSVLQDQITMLMNMLDETQGVEEDEETRRDT
ncbi:uncharacterized protein A4U43_C01F34310 [Asparagus officinalis]|uniref:Uncharacterized protein n=1 Tax=Asparagus officinalis TaxID=4686 RepID=A0A5P1FVU3_ASPOF|nr:protein HEADING DATE REPRESSOR 1 [Asparagus officinalis]ONK81923.1 uncharacterized protein A4U43_C01F34310 [Asparagus officinalis]